MSQQLYATPNRQRQLVFSSPRLLRRGSHLMGKVLLQKHSSIHDIRVGAVKMADHNGNHR